MEALEFTISSTLQKFEAEGSVVSEDIKLISGSLEKVKEIYQKCRKEKLNKGKSVSSLWQLGLKNRYISVYTCKYKTRVPNGAKHTGPCRTQNKPRESGLESSKKSEILGDPR